MKQKVIKKDKEITELKARNHKLRMEFKGIKKLDKVFDRLEGCISFKFHS